MKIETKYNIGDEVWFMAGGAACSKVKRAIAHCSSRGYHCWYKLENNGYFTEESLFPTKEELIKSL